MAPVGWVPEFGQTRIARRHVGGDQRVRLSLTLRGQDPEAPLPVGFHSLGGNRLDHGKRRRLVLQQEDELADRGLGPLGLDDHAVLVVQYVAREPQLERGAIDEGPKADALDRPGDPNARARGVRHLAKRSR